MKLSEILFFNLSPFIFCIIASIICTSIPLGIRVFIFILGIINGIIVGHKLLTMAIEYCKRKN